jgi:hypothetical protein
LSPAAEDPAFIFEERRGGGATYDWGLSETRNGARTCLVFFFFFLREITSKFSFEEDELLAMSLDESERFDTVWFRVA